MSDFGSEKLAQQTLAADQPAPRSEADSQSHPSQFRTLIANQAIEAADVSLNVSKSRSTSRSLAQRLNGDPKIGRVGTG